MGRDSDAQQQCFVFMLKVIYVVASFLGKGEHCQRFLCCARQQVMRPFATHTGNAQAVQAVQSSEGATLSVTSN